jgi:hypothetical protein
VWTAGSPWFRWKGRTGFRFAAISAAPYVPSNRCMDGSEYNWPTGPGEDEPEPRDVGPRNWPTLPGGHMVYYQRGRRLRRAGPRGAGCGFCGGPARVRAASSPKERGRLRNRDHVSCLERRRDRARARRENRLLRQPLLAQVTGPIEGGVRVNLAAPRQPVAELLPRAATPLLPIRSHSMANGSWPSPKRERALPLPAGGRSRCQVVLMCSGWTPLSSTLMPRNG